jgi:glucosamine kinase
MILGLPIWYFFGIVVPREIRAMLILGLDGGGTGCRAALADLDGTVIARAEGGPANIATDFDSARDSILSTLIETMKPVRATPQKVCVGLGLAGANMAGVSERLAASLPFPHLRIETDAVTAALGALGGADGIVAAIGTGSVFAVVEGSQVRQIGGWGLILGDEGSGATLGRAILSRALRAHDGHHPLTPLLSGLLAEHGGPGGIVAFARKARPADFATLAPQILSSDDPAARAAMAEAGAEVAAFVDLLQAGQNLPVVWTGGLGPTYAARLGSRWPQRAARGTALDGALILARGLL